MGTAAGTTMAEAVGTPVQTTSRTMQTAVQTAVQGTGTALETAEERDERRLSTVRGEVLRDRVLWWAAALGVLWLAGYAVATAATGSSPSGRTILGDLVYLVPVALAAGTSVFVARRVTGR